MKEVLVFSIIALFIGLAFIPSFNAICISKTDDTTPPEVKLVWDIEEGIVRFTAICSDDTGIDYVIFTWNAMIVAGCYEEPYEWIVDLETVNKQHICAGAWDLAGNQAWDCVDFRSRKLDIKSTDDCFDCLSNGKTHLAEKILTRLENYLEAKDLINAKNPAFDRPICIMLEIIASRYDELCRKYLLLKYDTPEGTPLYWYYSLLHKTYLSIVLYIIFVGWLLYCWGH